MLFQPGFSTAGETTDFSGSGEGLAAARDTVERVHGAVHIESIKGQGTTVTMTLPMSMVLQNVVVVAAGDQFWGFPEASVEAAMPLSKAEIKTTNGGRELHFESGAIPCVSLSQAVGTGVDADESEILVMNTRFGLVAVTVGELIDRRRVAVKNLGPILEGPGHVTGAALLGGGAGPGGHRPQLPRNPRPAAAPPGRATPAHPRRRRLGRSPPAPLGDAEWRRVRGGGGRGCP